MKTTAPISSPRKINSLAQSLTLTKQGVVVVVLLDGVVLLGVELAGFGVLYALRIA